MTKTLLRLIAWLPMRANHQLGAALGAVAHLLSGRNRAVVLRNLQLCYPHLQAAEHRALTKTNLFETGKNITELGAFWYWSKDKVTQLRQDETGREIFDAAKSSGKGVIVASPHFGAWELAGLLLSIEAPIHFLYRPNRNTDLDAPVIASRERFGGKCHPITGRGLAQLVRALKRGELIAILPDQEPLQDHGVFAPFYGNPAYTMTFMANLARKTGAPVVFTAVERLPAGRGYHVHYLQADDELYSEDAELSAAALNRCIERCIELAPQQYMWNYKRFRKSPPGTESRYR